MGLKCAVGRLAVHGTRTRLRTRLAVCLLMIVSSAGCVRGAGQILTPAGREPTRADAGGPKSGAVLQQLRSEEGASFHILHVHTEQPPQTIEQDVVLFVVQGKLKLHLGDRDFMIHVGDVVEIPRGTTHWVQNVASSESIAYLVFTPPFKAEGRAVVGGATKKVSAWHWTRWGN